MQLVVLVEKIIIINTHIGGTYVNICMHSTRLAKYIKINVQITINKNIHVNS